MKSGKEGRKEKREWMKNKRIQIGNQEQEGRKKGRREEIQKYMLQRRNCFNKVKFAYNEGSL